MSEDTGLRLGLADGPLATATLDEVNTAIARFGCRVWPLDLSRVPQAVRRSLGQEHLTAEDDARLRDEFFRSREQLLALIAEAGRPPQVAGGGEMRTIDATHDIHYPELYVVAPGNDYSRFDRLHRNVAADGTSVDETLQLVSGRGLRVVHASAHGDTFSLTLDCLAEQGWTVSYPGSNPHIGSLTDAVPGTKLLVQVIGPASWNMIY